MSDDLAAKLAALEQRLAAVEDELAIHRLIVRYGFGVDQGDADAAADVFTEDGVYYRVSFNRWTLAKRDGTWLIARRTTRVLGHVEALAVLRRSP